VKAQEWSLDSAVRARELNKPDLLLLSIGLLHKNGDGLRLLNTSRSKLT